VDPNNSLYKMVIEKSAEWDRVVLEECATKREERAALEQQVATLEAELEAGRAQELHWPDTAARASQPLVLLHRYIPVFRAQELHWPGTAARASQPLALLHRYTRISTIDHSFLSRHSSDQNW
jgi:hypothetical protein